MHDATTPTKDAIRHEYPWLRMRHGGAEYLPPEYYADLLRPYVFNGNSDLELFRRSIRARGRKRPLRILELGSGSGRATDLLRAEGCFDRGYVDLLDLSSQMLNAAMRKYGDSSHVRYIRSDIIDYVESTETKYDFVFSLWSWSHSVHQLVAEIGILAARRRVSQALDKFVRENLVSGGRMFIIHFDALSEEQRISLSVRRLKHTFFKPGKQSPSKLMLDEVFRQLCKGGLVKSACTHRIGKRIHFETMSDALEVFFNFHMECEFNERKDVSVLIKQVQEQIESGSRNRKIFSTVPGCFIFEVKRL